MTNYNISPSVGPRISVITVVLNGIDHIEKTMASVVDQTYENIDYIVVDGGSADGTQSIIKKYEDRLSYWISERDLGIYDAMNKGIDVSNGDWLFFLGSDDEFFNRSTIDDIARSLQDNLSLVFGKIMYRDHRIVKSRLNALTLLHNTVHHQSAFYNKKLFSAWRYDPHLKIISDYELNLKIYLSKMSYQYVDKFICRCDHRGHSRTNQKLAFRETNAVRGKYIHGVTGGILTALYTVKFGLNKG
jgi:putative colanic acid biosynthesis glycosyltransferase